MGLFGIKKAKEDSKPSNTFINNDVINADDYSNMPSNTVVGYNQPTDTYINNEVVEPVMETFDANNINNAETFVYSQVSSDEFNNQFVNVDMNQNSYENNAMFSNSFENSLQSADVSFSNPSEYVQQDSGVVYNEPVENVSQDFNAVYNEPAEYVQSDSNIMFSNSSEYAQQDENAYYDQNVVNTSDVVFTIDNNFNQVNNIESVPTQDYSTVEPVPFDNSALFALPAGAVVLEPEVEEEVIPVDEEVVEEEPEVVLDPLNNANNPIPVNPVASDEIPKVVPEEEEIEIPLFDEEEEIKTNLFTVISMMSGVLVKPGTTISVNAKRYKKMFDAVSISFWVTVISFALCLVGRIVVGCFSKTENAISGASKIVLDFSRLVDTNNYIPYLLITLFIGLGTILVVALVYYLSSFIFSKGIHIGTYFAISTLAVVPVIIGFTVLYPIITILSSGMAMMALIFSIIYALIILFTGINEVLKFKNNDHRIIYNSINMAIIFSIMMFIFKTLSYLNILDISILM